MMHQLHHETNRKGFGSDKSKMEHMFQIKCSFAPKQQAVAKNPPFLRWWIRFGYFGLCIPFRPVFDATNRRYKLKSNKLQKVINLPLTSFFHLLRKTIVTLT